MPSQTDSKPIPTATTTTILTPMHKDSSELLSKEIRSQQVAVDGEDVVVDNVNGIVNDDSDVITNTMASGSSSPFIHDGGVTTAAPSNPSTLDSNSLGLAQSNDPSGAQKSTQKSTKHQSVSRPPRRTRNSAKVVNIATTGQNDKDTATTPGSLSAN
ncbi:16475_t:CDS:1, partial [Acaulospora colombiana]